MLAVELKVGLEKKVKEYYQENSKKSLYQKSELQVILQTNKEENFYWLEENNS